MLEHVKQVTESGGASSLLLDSITAAIDGLEEAKDADNDCTEEDLPADLVVPVRSITFGGLTYLSRSTGIPYRWNQIGAVEPMTIQALNEMNTYKREFLRRPLVILMDERAVKKFRLTSIYENVATIHDLPNVFASGPAAMEQAISRALQANMRDILIAKVRQMIKSEALVDVNVIRLLEEKLQCDLTDGF